MLEVGTVVERYRIEAVVASGGMATVYRVRHLQLGSEHALKVLDLPSQALRERLLLEGQLQARLNHPNLVKVTDIIPVNDAFGLVMEFVDGPTLERWIEAGPGPEESVADRIAETERIFRGVMAAVGYAHRKGLVHRDLKPQNVLLEDADGMLNPKVLDFGIAKLLLDQKPGTLTRTGWGMGTPEYMAPEQLKAAKDVDGRADIWALGCILYAMYAGKSPFARDDLLHTFAALGTGEHVALQSIQPAVPDRIGNAVRACLQVSREQRVADCTSLSLILAGEPAAAGEPGDEVVPVRASRPPPTASTPFQRPLRETDPPGLAAGMTTPVPSAPAASATFGGVDDLAAARPRDDASQTLEADLAVDEPPPAKPATPQSSVTLDGPQPHPRAVRPPPPNPALVIVLAGVLLCVGVLAAAAGWAVYLVNSPDPTHTAAAPAPLTPPTTVSAPPATVSAPPDAEPAPPPEVSPTPSPDPAAPVTSDPVPVRPAHPSPAKPAAGKHLADVPAAPVASPAPAPTPAPVAAPEPAAPVVAAAPTKGTLVVTGDADDVWLKGEGGTFRAGKVPAGSYVWYAKLAGDEVPGTAVTVTAGATLTLDCKQTFGMCSKR